MRFKDKEIYFDFDFDLGCSIYDDLIRSIGLIWVYRYLMDSIYFDAETSFGNQFVVVPFYNLFVDVILLVHELLWFMLRELVRFKNYLVHYRH